MKKKITLVLIFSLFSLQAMATNGNMLISASPVARSMGGVGASFYTNELDGMFSNPAIIGKTDTNVGDHRILVGLLNTLSEIQSNNGTHPKDYPAGAFTNLPSIGYFMNLMDKFKFGTGFYLLAASGVDNSEYPQMNRSEVAVVSFRLTFNFAFQLHEKLWIGVSPDLLYSSGSSRKIGEEYDGDSVINPVYKIGIHYQPTKTTWLGFNFSKGADFELENYSDMNQYVSPYAGDKLGDSAYTGAPDYYNLGISQEFFDQALALILEYKKIYWSKTQGYGEGGMGLQDQNVYMIAAQYKFNPAWRFRLGWNHAKKPLRDGYNENGSRNVKFTEYVIWQQLVSAQAVQLVSPSEDHFSTGVGYEGIKDWKFNIGFMISPKATNQRTGVGVAGAYDYKTTFKYGGLDLMASYTF